MRSQSAVIAMNVITNLLLCFSKVPVASCWNPFGFKAFEEAFHRAIDAPVSRMKDLKQSWDIILALNTSLNIAVFICHFFLLSCDVEHIFAS